MSRTTTGRHVAIGNGAKNGAAAHLPNGSPAHAGAEESRLLELAADALDAVARGELPDKITGFDAGTAGKLTHALNSIIDNVRMRSGDIQQLIDASVQGRLDF